MKKLVISIAIMLGGYLTVNGQVSNDSITIKIKRADIKYVIDGLAKRQGTWGEVNDLINDIINQTYLAPKQVPIKDTTAIKPKTDTTSSVIKNKK